jgi:class 3 adenylate cyclase
MPQEEFRRQLTAILSADVKDYSRLMVEDEEGIIHILNEYKEVINDSFQRHRS